MTALARAAERIKRFYDECDHPEHPCFMCLVRAFEEYEERIGALEDARCDAGGWPLRDAPRPRRYFMPDGSTGVIFE